MGESPLSSTSGVITLQVGHFSNFVGTHWWNIQQSSKRAQGCSKDTTEREVHDGLFLREDLDYGTGKTTYTPRLLCIDLKGCLNSLKVDGTFQKRSGEERSGNLQQDNIENKMDIEKFAPNDLSIHQTESAEKYEIFDTSHSSDGKKFEVIENDPLHESHLHEPKYLSLHDTVDVWSDFLGNEYNRNSVLLLDDYWHSSDSCSFSFFGQGHATTANQKFWDSWEDGMHFFAEECDQLQGFQILTDLEDGFSGLAVRVLENLQDCYGPKTFAVYGCWPGIPNKYINENIEIMNSALAISSITQNNQLFIPLSLQEAFYGKEKSNRNFMHLSYKPESWYHTSAIIASYLDTMSLQYRLGNSSLTDFCNGMTVSGHSVASANISLPLNVTSTSIEDVLKSNIYNNGVMTSLTPSVSGVLPTLFSHQMVLRGIPSEYKDFVADKRLHKNVSNKAIFEKYVFDTYKSYKTVTTFFEEPLQTFHTCQRFSKSTQRGIRFLHTSGKWHSNLGIAPVLSSLSTTANIFDLFHDVIKSARRVNSSVYTSTEYFGMEQDEISESIEHLVNLAHLYDEKRAIELL